MTLDALFNVKCAFTVADNNNSGTQMSLLGCTIGNCILSVTSRGQPCVS